MSQMDNDMLGPAETWDGAGEFGTTTLPTTQENFKIMYSGGDKKRSSFTIITLTSRSNMHSCLTVSERITYLRLKAKRVDMIIIGLQAFLCTIQVIRHNLRLNTSVNK